MSAPGVERDGGGTPSLTVQFKLSREALSWALAIVGWIRYGSDAHRFAFAEALAAAKAVQPDRRGFEDCEPPMVVTLTAPRHAISWAVFAIRRYIVEGPSSTVHLSHEFVRRLMRAEQVARRTFTVSKGSLSWTERYMGGRRGDPDGRAGAFDIALRGAVVVECSPGPCDDTTMVVVLMETTASVQGWAIAELRELIERSPHSCHPLAYEFLVALWGAR